MSLGLRRGVRAALAAVVVVLFAAACGRTSMEIGDQDLLPSAGQGGSGGKTGLGGNGGTGLGGNGGSGGIAGQGGTGGIAGSGGVGGMGPCAIAADCDDKDFCTTDSCIMGSCVHQLKDSDADGVPDVACGGSDCNDKNPNVHPGLPENCTDGADNDCNGVADCFDPACLKAPKCGCAPSGNEQCSNTIDDDCNTFVDCNDPACIGTPACGCAMTELSCGNGIDDDCDKAIDCQDSDCAQSQLCACLAQQEDCQNGIDDDCNLLIDCADPSCKGVGPCACKPPGIPELCTDTVDNDCDGKVDCGDPDCAGNPACKMCTQEQCSDGKDNDCNGKIDCADPACVFAPNCPATQEQCNNGLDDDLDGLTDCADPDCVNNPVCVQKHENCLTAQLISQTGKYTGNTKGFVSKNIGSCGGGAGEAVFKIVLSQPARVHLDSKGTSFDSVIYVRHGNCGEGPELACDDDSGGNKWSAALDFNILYPGTDYIFVDGFTVDPQFGANEGPYVLNVEIEPNPQENTALRCSDGKDNDGDVYVDCGDPDCVSVGSCLNCAGGKAPSAEFGVAKCTDKIDNDCDGKTDALDPDCNASPYASALEKCNGLDENDNKIADDFACRCAQTSECSGTPGQICYTHTIHSCGLPCFQFFGNVCPSIATGTSCNKATGQCEFP